MCLWVCAQAFAVVGVSRHEGGRDGTRKDIHKKLSSMRVDLSLPADLWFVHMLVHNTHIYIHIYKVGGWVKMKDPHATVWGRGVRMTL